MYLRAPVGLIGETIEELAVLVGVVAGMSDAVIPRCSRDTGLAPSPGA